MAGQNDVFDTKALQEWAQAARDDAARRVERFLLGVSTPELRKLADQIGKLWFHVEYYREQIAAETSEQFVADWCASATSCLQTACGILVDRGQAGVEVAREDKAAMTMCCQCQVKTADAEYGLCKVCFCETRTRERWRQIAEARAYTAAVEHPEEEVSGRVRGALFKASDIYNELMTALEMARANR